MNTFTQTLEKVAKSWGELFSQTTEGILETDEFVNQMKNMDRFFKGLFKVLESTEIQEEPKFYTEKIIEQVATCIVGMMAIVSNAVRPMYASDALEVMLDSLSQVLDQQVAVMQKAEAGVTH